MSRQLTTDELDFDEIKKGIKEFLKSQDVLKDYNYEGSALSVLLDILAYNTHFNSLYTNLVANEMFLDSVSKYSSAVSLAKTIGYVPRSYRSSIAKIDLKVTLPASEVLSSHTIPKGTTFISPIGTIDYTFSTITDYTAPRIDGAYTFYGIELYEGIPQSRTYTTVDGSRFVVPHKKADTTTLKVSVKDSGSSSVINTFTYAQDLLTVKGNDPVFFVKQREDLFYEVYFGNNFIGKSVVIGNVVTLDYLLSSGSGSNGAKVFTYFGGHRAELQYDVTLVAAAVGGAEAETIESIKFNAPKAYTAQNRAVTVSDYETTIINNFPNIESVKVWGGQDHVPKTYGKVFICAKPVDREFMTLEEIDAIRTLLVERRVMTMIPTFVSPEFMRLELTVAAYYNPSISRKTPGELTTLVSNVVKAYADTLNSFEASFRYSVLASKIDAANEAIVSNITSVRVRSPLQPFYNLASNYSVNYANPIYKKPSGGTLFSTRFYEVGQTDRCYLVDDGAGNLQLMTESISGVATKIRNTGTVDYVNGTVTITNLNVIGLYDAEFEIVFYPSSNDVIPVRQFILTIPDDLTTITLISDKAASGDAQAGSTHIFTPSR
jgi:hypothetical protein